MMQQKHAYLIMAHNNFYCLEKLVRLLDDARNDIFIHIDAKIQNFDFIHFRNLCKNANLIYTTKRINVQWGTHNQVKAEMLLFQTAVDHNTYHYYHLLSGSDLPLKTQNEIHDFFEQTQECFITIHDSFTQYDYQRISRYHGIFGHGSVWRNKLNAYSAFVQEKLKVDRIGRLQGLILKRGWNWVSLPHCAVELLIKRRNFIQKLTRYTLCADEVYKQVVLLNSDCETIKICGDSSSLRLVDWKRGDGKHPHIFTIEDYDMLSCSSMLFARKFDEKVDKQIIDMLFNRIIMKQQAEAQP